MMLQAEVKNFKSYVDSINTSDNMQSVYNILLLRIKNAPFVEENYQDLINIKIGTQQMA